MLRLHTKEKRQRASTFSSVFLHYVYNIFMDSIQIFACDHRKNADYSLPFIRLGNSQSDAAINIKDDDELRPYHVVLSEGAQIWWVWKHLKELGNPDYIGFCHYRRFFGRANSYIKNITWAELPNYKPFSPIEQLSILNADKLDGIVPIAFNPLKDIAFKDIAKQTKYFSDSDGLGFTSEVVCKSFELLLECCPEDLRKHVKSAMANDCIYVCNIFTMKRELFETYGQIVFAACHKLNEFVKNIDISNFHKRWMGYILERFTSCIIHAFQLAGYNFGICSLITTDGHIHEPYEKHVGK